MLERKDVKIEIIHTKQYTKEQTSDLDELELAVFYCAENLYKDLEVFSKFLSETKKDEYMYKWAILAIHNALVGFMLTAIRGNNWKAVLNKSKKKEEKIISTMQLYTIIEETYFFYEKENNRRREFVERLNNLRNDFSHPYYDWNLIDKVLLKKIFRNAIGIIENLMIHSQDVKEMLEDIEDGNMEKMIGRIKKQLK